MLTPNEYFSLPQHAVDQFARMMVVELSDLIELLLQRKSLHEKLYLDPDAIEAEIMEHVRAEHKKTVRHEIAEIRRNLLGVNSSRSQSPATAKGRPEIAIRPMLPDIQRFCQACKQVAMFRLIAISHAYQDPLKSTIPPALERTEDIWSRSSIWLEFQCQCCKSTPEGVVIKRNGWELWLDSRLRMQEIGRSPCLP